MVKTAYVKCVFCQMNKPIRSKRYPGGFFEIPPFEGDPSEAEFIMLMEQSPGPGRGRREKVGGWVKTEALSLGEALEDPEFNDLARDFKAKLINLVRAYIEHGVIIPEEIW